MGKYDAIKVGDTAAIERLITNEDVAEFAKLSGDDNKIHLDADFASRTPFKKPVAHGMIGASLLSAVIGTKLPGDGALWYSQNVDYPFPVRVGDKLRVSVEVTKKHDREKSLELKVLGLNQNKQVVMSGTAKVKVVEAEDAVAPNPETEREKTVLVIGATGGIGRAVCRAFAADGFDVALHYRNNKELAETLAADVRSLGRKAQMYAADITKPGDVESLMAGVSRQFPRIDALVHCATDAVPAVPFKMLEWKDFTSSIEMQVGSLYRLVCACLPLMVPGSAVVGFSSIYAEIPKAGFATYITAKSALSGFVKSLAVELAASGVRANLVSPGITDTDLIADLSEKSRLVTAAATPLKRLASPDDVAQAALFLGTRRSAFVTGQTVRINGGQFFS